MIVNDKDLTLSIPNYSKYGNPEIDKNNEKADYEH